MNKTKDQKIALVKDLTESLKNATSTVFVGFKGMNVADETAMRRSLRGDSVKYTVVKKTLIRRAIDALGLTASDAKLEGEVALAYGEGDDATAAARLIHDFGKKFKGTSTSLSASKLVILGGIFEGKLVNQMGMQEIATIPSLQVLRGMLANVINSPIQGLAVVLKAYADKKGA